MAASEENPDLNSDLDRTGRRCDGGSNSNEINGPLEVITRSGRTVKPTAVIRERNSGNSSAECTPIKRKVKGGNKRAKRTKFTYQTSSEDTTGTSQNSLSQSSVSGVSTAEEGECGAETDSQADKSVDTEFEVEDGEQVHGPQNTNENARMDNRSQNRSTVKRVRSVVTKVNQDVTTDEDQEIDKSINFIMSNEAAFERVMKNCMPAFFQMSQKVSDKAANETPTPSTSTGIGTDTVLERGESDQLNVSVTNEMTGLTLGEERGNSDKQRPCCSAA